MDYFRANLTIVPQNAPVTPYRKISKGAHYHTAPAVLIHLLGSQAEWKHRPNSPLHTLHRAATISATSHYPQIIPRMYVLNHQVYKLCRQSLQRALKLPPYYLLWAKFSNDPQGGYFLEGAFQYAGSDNVSRNSSASLRCFSSSS